MKFLNINIWNKIRNLPDSVNKELRILLTAFDL